MFLAYSLPSIRNSLASSKAASRARCVADAFADAATAAVYDAAWIGIVVAAVVSICMSYVHGFASISHRGNQPVSSAFINLIAAGLPIILYQAWLQQGYCTSSLKLEAYFDVIDIPKADIVRDKPIIDHFYSILLS